MFPQEQGHFPMAQMGECHLTGYGFFRIWNLKQGMQFHYLHVVSV